MTSVPQVAVTGASAPPRAKHRGHVACPQASLSTRNPADLAKRSGISLAPKTQQRMREEETERRCFLPDDPRRIAPSIRLACASPLIADKRRRLFPPPLESQISQRTWQAPHAWEGGPAASACQPSPVEVATVAQSLAVRTNPSFQTKS
jgi:hypothetical protein